MPVPADAALVGGRRFEGLEEVTDQISALDGGGLWVVVLPFAGRPVCARFRVAERAPPAPSGRSRRSWAPVARSGWRSSMSRPAFGTAVEAIRESIAAGDVYQVNLCRRLSAPRPAWPDLLAVGEGVARSHPSPFAAVVQLPSVGVHVLSASPERFLRRDGDLVESRPIKGTAAASGGFSPKDRAENVMIVDLVRNDLGRVCEYGTVEVAGLCQVEAHPGLYHLVSTVCGRLRSDVGWTELLAATFPPGSVTGAPKLAALDVIARLEPVPRGIYCGAIGWVDGDRRTADLAVAIRTFWIDGDELHLGVGGAITWDSTVGGEWEETELKAERLLAAMGAGG